LLKTGGLCLCGKDLQKGIMKNALPIQFLRQRHQQFQRRLSRHWLNAGQDGTTKMTTPWTEEVGVR
jgi:hypothetical protein